MASCTEGGIESTDNAVCDPVGAEERTRSARTPESLALWAPASLASDRANRQIKSDRMMRSGPIMTLAMWKKYGALNLEATTRWGRTAIRAGRQYQARASSRR